MASIARLGHVGIHVGDLERSVRFYRDVLGLQVTDEDQDAGMIFMSAQPEVEHHELLLCGGRTGPADAKVVQQISFRCNSLDDILEYHRRFRELNVPVDMEVSHGNALAIYFFDPDGNRCEVYWNTGLQARQPYLVYVDLDQPPDKIMAEVADSVRQYAGTGYVDPRFLALQDITPGTSASG